MNFKPTKNKLVTSILIPITILALFMGSFYIDLGVLPTVPITTMLFYASLAIIIYIVYSLAQKK